MFTFKKDKRQRGLAGVGEVPGCDIKLQKKKVGHLYPPSRFKAETEWSVSFMVKKEPTKEDPCPWRWVNLKAKFPNEQDARVWVNEKFEAIITKYDLHTNDD